MPHDRAAGTFKKTDRSGAAVTADRATGVHAVDDVRSRRSSKPWIC